MPAGQVCPRAGRDGELLSPRDLLEDVAATAPNVHSNSQHHHGEAPGFQQQLVCSALASSGAGPWLSSPPASPAVLLPLLPDLGKGFPHSACGYREKEQPGEHHRSLHRQRLCAPSSSAAGLPEGPPLPQPPGCGCFHSCGHRLLQQDPPLLSPVQLRTAQTGRPGKVLEARRAVGFKTELAQFMGGTA